MFITFFKAFLLAAVISAALTPVAIKLAPKLGLMDVPKDGRRMHDHPIPRCGGICIFIGMLVSILVFVPRTEGLAGGRQVIGFLAGAAMIVILGIIDDFISLPPKIKLAGQIVCAIVPCFFSVRIFGITNIFGEGYIIFPTWFAVILTVLWIVGITNTINLIDGLDGLAAGVSCISCIAVAYTSYLAGRPETCQLVLAIAGAAFGFLIFNFHPAKIFMGDAGSMLLGYSLATMSLVGVSSTKGTVLFVSLIPLIILALPIFDTAFAIIRRVAHHRSIMAADKGHLHHRIMALGLGQARTVLALYCISAIMGVAGILWTMHSRFEAIILAVIGATLIFVFLGIDPLNLNQDDTDAHSPLAERRDGGAFHSEQGDGGAFHPAETGDGGVFHPETATVELTAGAEAAPTGEAMQLEENLAASATAPAGETARPEEITAPAVKAPTGEAMQLEENLAASATAPAGEAVQFEKIAATVELTAASEAAPAENAAQPEEITAPVAKAPSGEAMQLEENLAASATAPSAAAGQFEKIAATAELTAGADHAPSAEAGQFEKIATAAESIVAAHAAPAESSAQLEETHAVPDSAPAESEADQ